ncbi:MAG: hypothetical protein DRN81_01025 [Thermoproteota archaeon]|nr:MAG: hypothetical protein DRN81_01025 [Candidatus Korarchaeota archaeon]
MKTLVSAELTKVGEKFIHAGMANVCKKCRLKKVCMGNLKIGRIYKIVKIYDKIFPCEIYGSVKLAEVEPAPLLIAYPSSKVISNALMTYSQIPCDISDCEYFGYCGKVRGLKEGDKFKIVKVAIEKIRCRKGYDLKLLEVQPIV